MKIYSNSRPHKIRLAIRALVENPDANMATIAKLARISPNTAAKYADFLKLRGGNPLEVLLLGDTDLVQLMSAARAPSNLHEFDFEIVHKRLKLGFSRKQCYKKYLDELPDGARPMKYRTFCARLETLLKTQNPKMKLLFRAGDVMMADFAGYKPIAIGPSGSASSYAMFVATLPCSQLIFAMIMEGERVEDWLGGLTEALHFFGGVPRRVIPDNPRALVLKPRRG
jgi:hypothetical protein